MNASAIRFISAILLTLGAPRPGVSQDHAPVLSFETLNYPIAARVKHVEGIVVVRAEYDETGRVRSAEALSGLKELVSESVGNARKWRFRVTTAGSCIIVYQFRIDGLCNLPCPSHFIVRPPNLAVISIGEAVLDH